MGGDEDVAVEAVSGDEAAARCSANRCAAARHVAVVVGKQGELAGELVQPCQASARINSQELAAELVVGGLQEQEVMLSDGAAEPRAEIVVFARMQICPSTLVSRTSLTRAVSRRCCAGA